MSTGNPCAHTPLCVHICVCVCVFGTGLSKDVMPSIFWPLASGNCRGSGSGAGWFPACLCLPTVPDIGYMVHLSGTHSSGIVLRLMVWRQPGLFHIRSCPLPNVPLGPPPPHLAKYFECRLDHLCRLTSQPPSPRGLESPSPNGKGTLYQSDFFFLTF